jgi:hypothetical protein
VAAYDGMSSWGFLAPRPAEITRTSDRRRPMRGRTTDQYSPRYSRPTCSIGSACRTWRTHSWHTVSMFPLAEFRSCRPRVAAWDLRLAHETSKTIPSCDDRGTMMTCQLKLSRKRELVVVCLSTDSTQGSNCG